MIYTDIQLKEKISQMMESFESEVIEFKEARTNYSFNDMCKRDSWKSGKPYQMAG